MLDRNGIYTIGTTVGRDVTSKGVYIDYFFVFGNSEYSGSRQPENYNVMEEGGRYFVIFIKEDPDNNRILWDKPVPEHITESPPEGWEEIP